MVRKLTYSGQVKTIVKDNNIIGCHQAQVWDEAGKSFAVIEPTIDESEATRTAELFSRAFEMEYNEELFRNFIRTHHMSREWEEFLNKNSEYVKISK